MPSRISYTPNASTRPPTAHPPRGTMVHPHRSGQARVSARGPPQPALSPFPSPCRELFQQHRLAAFWSSSTYSVAKRLCPVLLETARPAELVAGTG